MARTNLIHAIYRNGQLQLLQPVNLEEGAQVWLKVTAARPGKKRLREPLYPTHPQPAETLERLSGLISLGGDALRDSEALYDDDTGEDHERDICEPEKE